MEILQMCCLSKRTGELIFGDQDNFGVVYLQNGDIIHAHINNQLLGEDAVIELLLWPVGGFQANEGVLPSTQTVQATWEEILERSSMRQAQGLVAQQAAADPFVAPPVAPMPPMPGAYAPDPGQTMGFPPHDAPPPPMPGLGTFPGTGGEYSFGQPPGFPQPGMVPSPQMGYPAFPDNSEAQSLSGRPKINLSNTMPTLTHYGGSNQGMTFDLSKPAIHLGRAPDNDIGIPDGSISSRHCVFLVSEYGVVVRDLNSSNGTYVNGQPISETPLQIGDIIRVGTSLLKFGLTMKRPKLGAADLNAQAAPAGGAITFQQIVDEKKKKKGGWFG